MLKKAINEKIRNNLSCIDTDKLPDKIQLLISLVGLPSAYLFISICSGKKLYIPKNPLRSQLHHIIDEKTLDTISCHFCGEIIEVPKVEHFHRQIRNKIIQEWIDKGKSNSEIAQEVGLSYRQIVNIKKALNSEKEDQNRHF